MLNPWLALTFRTARLIWEAQGVMALRLIKLARGGSAAQSEASGMIGEKLAAFLDAQAVAATAVLGGSSGARTATRVLNVYRRKVPANRRRLAK
jgi:hypothetical protein